MRLACGRGSRRLRPRRRLRRLLRHRAARVRAVRSGDGTRRRPNAAWRFLAMLRVGLISDTHGLLRPEARAFLRGCDHIVHAGDISDASVLDELSVLAPVTAVRGNNDRGAWAEALRETAF